MSNASEQERARLFNLLSKLGIMVTDGKLDAGYYADVLQAVMGKEAIHIGPLPKKNPTFLLPEQQFFGIIRYNEWLKKEASKQQISRKEIEDLELLVPEMAMNDLIFYFHKAGLLVTCELAWKYICNQRGEGRFWKSDCIQFKKEYLGLAGGEPERPTGFYTKKLHKDDYEAGAIGKRFQKQCVEETRKIIRAEGSWGMGPEGLQFMFTHPHYPELMDGDKVPFVDLPGLKVAPSGDSDFYSAPYLNRGEAKFRLVSDNVRDVHSRYGSGSLL